MFRLILFLGLLAFPAAADVSAFRPSLAHAQVGPARAVGALVWLQGGVSPGQYPDGQPAPEWLGRVAGRGWDIWRHDRIAGQDALAIGADGLIAGLEALRAAGYRRLIVAGFSRGAFIAMAALARPDLVEAVALLSPAAHGTREERRPQALADYAARLAAAKGPMRLALAQFNDDPFDPDPAARGRLARETAVRLGLKFHPIYLPLVPEGHMASFEAEFDALFGAEMVGFLLGD